MLISESVEYMKDWDWDENTAHGILPEKTTTGSRTRIYWKYHVCGGKWDVQMKERRGCPYCSGFKALPGFNDLATLYPKLAEQWAYEKNGSLTPKQVTIGSQKSVYWRCDNGHLWDMPVRSRVRGQGCPFCNNRRILTGYNDLATTNPNLADEWDYKKNTDFHPQKINGGSKKKSMVDL